VLIAWIAVLDVLQLMFVMNVKKDSTGGLLKVIMMLLNKLLHLLFVKHLLYVTLNITVTGLQMVNNYVTYALML
jgi:hypothetical protein